mmetsp:Transcript_13367/g.32315  ORF Transcript_13367/g.32315 Transcript_13367/m.32315 type:complete len:112 (-) Transcript_13367:373-708(-)
MQKLAPSLEVTLQPGRTHRQRSLPHLTDGWQPAVLDHSQTESLPPAASSNWAQPEAFQMEGAVQLDPAELARVHRAWETARTIHRLDQSAAAKNSSVHWDPPPVLHRNSVK